MNYVANYFLRYSLRTLHMQCTRFGSITSHHAVKIGTSIYTQQTETVWRDETLTEKSSWWI